VHHREGFEEVAVFVEEEVETAVAVVAEQGAYPMLDAAAEVTAIVPGPVLVLVLVDGIDLCIQHLALMAETAAKLADEAEEETEGGLALEHSYTEGEIEHEVDMAVGMPEVVAGEVGLIHI
jgi:hypothetical protein